MGIEIRECEAKYFPSLECMTHCSNAGSLSWPDIVMLAATLKGQLCRGDVGSRERGE